MSIEFDQLTPREILIRLGIHAEKPKPDELLLENSINNLPVSNREMLALTGYGDWDRGRSSEGSAVVSNKRLNYVLKLPIGKSYQSSEAIERARSMSQTAMSYSNNGPDTGFFVAQIDGPNSPPKVITFQLKNDGKTTCDTTLGEIIKPDIIKQFDRITSLFITNLNTSGLIDYEGLMYDKSNIIKKVISKLICGIPLFSDNTMISNSGVVQITDNTPDPIAHSAKNNFSKIIKIARIKISWLITKNIAKTIFLLSMNKGLKKQSQISKLN